MNKYEFVSELKKLLPPNEYFIKMGYPTRLIDKAIKGYLLPVKSSNLNISHTNIDVLDLLQSYDCSNVEIGILSFCSNVQEISSHYIVGNVEQDILAVNKVTLQVEVLDIHDYKTIIWLCATNSSCFLDALLICLEHTNQCIKNPSLGTDKLFEKEYIILASEKAGGKRYEEFYKMIFGVYSD